MKWRVMHILAAVSLALALVTAGAWVRSYWVCDQIIKRTAQTEDGLAGEATTWALRANRGRLDLQTDWTSLAHSTRDERSPLQWISRPSGVGTARLCPPGSGTHTDADGTVSTLSGRGWRQFGFDRLDIEYRMEGWQLSTRTYQLRLPHALLVLVLAVLPAMSLQHMYKNQLGQRCRRAGLCPGCGYDLRATPERCPECGTAFTERVAS